MHKVDRRKVYTVLYYLSFLSYKKVFPDKLRFLFGNGGLRSNLSTIKLFFLSFLSDLVGYEFIRTMFDLSWIPLARYVYLHTMLITS